MKTLFALLILTISALAQPTTQPSTLRQPTPRELRRITLTTGVNNATAVRKSLVWEPGDETPDNLADDTPNDPSDDVPIGGTIVIPAAWGKSCLFTEKLDLSGMRVHFEGQGDASIIALRGPNTYIDCQGSIITNSGGFRVLGLDALSGFVACRKTQGVSVSPSINRSRLDNVRCDGTWLEAASVFYGCEHLVLAGCHFDNRRPGGTALSLDSGSLVRFGKNADINGATNSFIKLDDVMLTAVGQSGAGHALLVGDQTTDLCGRVWVATNGEIGSLIKVNGYRPAFGRSRSPINCTLEVFPESSPFPAVTCLFTGTARISQVKFIGEWADLVIDGIKKQ